MTEEDLVCRLNEETKSLAIEQAVVGEKIDGLGDKFDGLNSKVDCIDKKVIKLGQYAEGTNRDMAWVKKLLMSLVIFILTATLAVGIKELVTSDKTVKTAQAAQTDGKQ